MVTEAVRSEVDALIRAWLTDPPARLENVLAVALSQRDAALLSLLNLIPTRYQVRVCEGGGPENVEASLAVSIVKLIDAATGRGR